MLEISAAPVAVRFVTCDRRRGTGGEFRELKSARLSSHKPRRDQKRVSVPVGETGSMRISRPARHFTNATRNLVDTSTGKLVKVHIYLLVAVAGRKVIL